MITKKIIADKILAYMQHRLSLSQLVSWAEDALANMQYDEENKHTTRNVLAQLGLADVKNFGLDWEQCELLMHNLGYKLQINALETSV